MGRRFLLSACLVAAASTVRAAQPCPLLGPDGKPVGAYVCDFLRSKNPESVAAFPKASRDEKQRILKEAGDAYQTYQQQRDSLLSKTPPGAQDLNALRQSRETLEQSGDAILEPFKAARAEYALPFAQRETELNQAIAEQEKALGVKQQAATAKAYTKFQQEAGAAGGLGSTAGALDRGADAQNANNRLFNGSGAKSPAASGGDQAALSRLGSGPGSGVLADKENRYDAVPNGAVASPDTFSAKPSLSDRYRGYCADSAAQAEKAGADHLVAADDPNAPWYSRWYHKTAAAADAVKQSAYEVASGDPKPWKESGEYWTQKGAALNADAESLDENGLSGAKKFAEKSAAMGMLVTGHLESHAPEYAQKSADFTGKLADGDGDAWKETGSAALHAPIVIVKGVYESGKDAAQSWKEFGGMDSHTTTYNGLVATAKTVGFASVFVVPAEGVGAAAARTGAREAVEAAGVTAGKDTAQMLVETQGKQAAEQSAAAAAKTLVKEPPPVRLPEAVEVSKEPAGAAQASENSGHPTRNMLRAQILEAHQDAYETYVRSLGSEPEELSPKARKLFVDGYLQNNDIAADSPLAKSLQDAVQSKSPAAAAGAAPRQAAAAPAPPQAIPQYLSHVKDERAYLSDVREVSRNSNGISVDGRFAPERHYVASVFGEKVPTTFYSGQNAKVVSDMLDQDGFIAKAYKEGGSVQDAGGASEALRKHVLQGDTRYFISTTDSKQVAFQNFGQVKGYVIEVSPKDTPMYRTENLWSSMSVGEQEREWVAHGAIPSSEIPRVSSVVSGKTYELGDPAQAAALRKELDFVKSLNTQDVEAMRRAYRAQFP